MTYIDANYQGVAKAVADNINQDIKPLLVDPVTGRLLIEIIIETHPAANPPAKIDENYEGVSLAVTDDTNQTIKPLKVHPTSGALLVDVVIE